MLEFRLLGKRNRPTKNLQHAANHAFCKAFLVKHFPHSELVRQHMNETLQVAGCVEGGVRGLAAAVEQRNAELADDPVAQAAHLGGTGVTRKQANAPPVGGLEHRATGLHAAPPASHQEICGFSKPLWSAPTLEWTF